MNKKFKNRCVIASSVNGWMDTLLSKVWVNNVLRSFSLACRSLVWDSFQCHIEESITTSYKPPVVSWYKSFMKKVTDLYDVWLAEEGLGRLAAARNLKAPPRKSVVQWILTDSEFTYLIDTKWWIMWWRVSLFQA